MIRKLKNLGHLVWAMIANLYFGFPSRGLTVIGVTGTDGKTTTASLIYHFLKTAGKKVALVSTVSAKIGDETISTGFHVTSPNPWQLQKLIKKVNRRGLKFLILEVTSHGLDQHRFFGINFALSVLTNISHEHLDYHKTFDNYIATKAKLFANSQVSILNADDASAIRIQTLLANKKFVTYSRKTASPKILAAAETRFEESFNVQNALAAATAAQKLGVSPAKIVSGLKTFKGVKGRMEKIPNQRDLSIYVDFAHTPNGLKQALKSLRMNPSPEHGRIIAIFGAAGLRDRSKRPKMGKVASSLADIVVLTAEDPRTEEVNDIIAQIKSGMTGKATVYEEPDRLKAIDLAINELAKKGDIIGVFGKGHEESMCFGKIEYPWSDHEAIKNVLIKK